ARQRRVCLLTRAFTTALARLDLDLVPPLVAIEEVIRGGAEPLPQRFRLAAADRADRLPLRLQAPHLRGGPLPLARVGQLLGPGAQRFLLRLVGRPDF